MKKANRVLVLVLALVLAVSLFGCGGKTQTKTPATSGQQTGETPKADNTQATISTKDTVVVRQAAEPMALLPAAMNDKNAELVTEQVLEPLFYTGLDGTIVPCLATEWKYGDAENTEMVITLRDDVYFHNGEKMTVDDVVFSYNTSIASKSTANVNTALDHME